MYKDLCIYTNLIMEVFICAYFCRYEICSPILRGHKLNCRTSSHFPYIASPASIHPMHHLTRYCMRGGDLNH